MSVTYVTNMRNQNGSAMTKAEVITRLVEASMASGYPYTDKAEECYDMLVKHGIYNEAECGAETCRTFIERRTV